jgi:hypothetical protein
VLTWLSPVRIKRGNWGASNLRSPIGHVLSSLCRISQRLIRNIVLQNPNTASQQGARSQRQDAGVARFSRGQLILAPFAEQAWQLDDVARYAPRFILSQHICNAGVGLILSETTCLDYRFIELPPGLG